MNKTLLSDLLRSQLGLESTQTPPEGSTYSEEGLAGKIFGALGGAALTAWVVAAALVVGGGLPIAVIAGLSVNVLLGLGHKAAQKQLQAEIKEAAQDLADLRKKEISAAKLAGHDLYPDAEKMTAKEILQTIALSAALPGIYVGYQSDETDQKAKELHEKLKQYGKELKATKVKLDVSNESYELSAEEMEAAAAEDKDASTANDEVDQAVADAIAEVEGSSAGVASGNDGAAAAEETAPTADEAAATAQAAAEKAEAAAAEAAAAAQAAADAAQGEAAASDAGEPAPAAATEETAGEGDAAPADANADASADAAQEPTPAAAEEVAPAVDAAASEPVADAPAATAEEPAAAEPAPAADAPADATVDTSTPAANDDAPPADAVADEPVAAATDDSAPAAAEPAAAATEEPAPTSEPAADASADAAPAATETSADAPAGDAAPAADATETADAAPAPAAAEEGEGEAVQADEATVDSLEEDEFSEGEVALKQLETAHSGLESILFSMESSLRQGGMSPCAAQFANLALEARLEKIGLTADAAGFPSFESYGAASSRETVTMESMEQVKAILAKIMAAAKKLLAHIQDLVKKAVIKYRGASAYLKKEGQELIEFTRVSTGIAKPVKLTALQYTRLNIKGKVNPKEDIQKIKGIAETFKKMASETSESEKVQAAAVAKLHSASDGAAFDAAVKNLRETLKKGAGETNAIFKRRISLAGHGDVVATEVLPGNFIFFSPVLKDDSQMNDVDAVLAALNSSRVDLYIEHEDPNENYRVDHVSKEDVAQIGKTVIELADIQSGLADTAASLTDFAKLVGEMGALSNNLDEERQKAFAKILQASASAGARGMTGLNKMVTWLALRNKEYLKFARAVIDGSAANDNQTPAPAAA